MTAFAAAGSTAQFAYATHDTEVIKTYVRTGLGVGLLAEMAAGDMDLVHLPIEGLPASRAYALVRRDRVVRDYVVDFIAILAPHVTRRDILRGLQPGAGPLGEETPTWAEWRRRMAGLAVLSPKAVAA
jgi:LysR family transcriptional regulator, cys regulon transcriptional activator